MDPESGSNNADAAISEGTDTGQRDERANWETCHGIRRKIEVVAACAMVLVVWILLSLPIVFYFVGPEEPHADNAPIKFTNCGNSSSNCTDNTTQLPLEFSNLSCQEGFLRVDGICIAQCDSWEQSSHAAVVTVQVTLLLAASLIFIGGIAVFIASCIWWKNMLAFPTVFIVYMCIGLAVISIFLLINYIDQDYLYCDGRSVEESLQNPTAFCTTSGIFRHYLFLNITLWWFFHVCSMCWKVTFPLHARKYQPYQKYIHVVLVLAGVLIPIPSVAAALLTGGYSINQFPPILCGAKDPDVRYYSLWFIINIVLAIGITMLIIIFWKVHKHQGFFRPKSTKSLKLSSVEKKLLLVSVYYIVFAALFLAYFSVSTRDLDKYLDATTVYFTCEALGHNPNDPCPKNYEQYVHPYLQSAVYIIMGFIPASSLVLLLRVRRKQDITSHFSGRTASQAPRYDSQQ